MSAHRSQLLVVGLAAAASMSGLMVTQGVASATPVSLIPVTTKQCTAGGGTVFVSYPKPDRRVLHPTPNRTCTAGTYKGRRVVG